MLAKTLGIPRASTPNRHPRYLVAPKLPGTTGKVNPPGGPISIETEDFVGRCGWSMYEDPQIWIFLRFPLEKQWNHIWNPLNSFRVSKKGRLNVDFSIAVYLLIYVRDICKFPTCWWTDAGHECIFTSHSRAELPGYCSYTGLIPNPKNGCTRRVVAPSCGGNHDVKLKGIDRDGNWKVILGVIHVFCLILGFGVGLLVADVSSQEYTWIQIRNGSSSSSRHH